MKIHCVYSMLQAHTVKAHEVQNMYRVAALSVVLWCFTAAHGICNIIIINGTVMTYTNINKLLTEVQCFYVKFLSFNNYAPPWLCDLIVW